MWFEDLTGFAEENPDQVRTNLHLDGNTLTSRVNGRGMVCGKLMTPSLGELRERVQSGEIKRGRLTVNEIVADVRHLHADTSSAGALFQVASQFNLLEMAHPNATPEQGVGIYEFDHTQGPACAIAAGAGTIYRNYYAMVKGKIGQSAQNQIDCLADMGAALGNEQNRLWEMRNGYALASQEGLVEIKHRLQAAGESERDAFRRKLRIGIQQDTQVTIDFHQHLVSQAYCSALPVAYSRHPRDLWEPFARLVLEASYEATLCAAILNGARTANKRLYLTLLGGGAFGNDTAWIIAAIERALALYADADLDVQIVSYGSSSHDVHELMNRWATRS